MSGLTNNPNKGKRKFGLIDRGNDIKPNSPVKMNEVLLNEKNKNTESEESQQKQHIDSITYDVTIRANNHCRNKLQALSIIGLAETQKEALDNAIDEYIESLPTEEIRKFKNQLNVLEERDITKKNKRS